MTFIAIHIIVCAMTIWIYLHRSEFDRSELAITLINIALIHLLLVSIYLWYFNVHNVGFRYFEQGQRYYNLF